MANACNLMLSDTVMKIHEIDKDSSPPMKSILEFQLQSLLLFHFALSSLIQSAHCWPAALTKTNSTTYSGFNFFLEAVITQRGARMQAGAD